MGGGVRVGVGGGRKSLTKSGSEIKEGKGGAVYDSTGGGGEEGGNWRGGY